MRAHRRAAKVRLAVLPALLLVLGLVEPARADDLGHLASISGTVSAARPFRAARVHARNAERRVSYMVYTSGGRFSAVNMFPGTYEVSVSAAGLVGRPQSISIGRGESATLDLRLESSDSAAVVAGRQAADPGVALAAFDEIYPPGPALDTLRETCIRCHGVNWIPQKSGLDEAGWNALLDAMLSMNDSIWGVEAGTPMMPADAISDAERGELVRYLVANFGPGTRPRMVRNDEPAELDEAALGKAMWIEYTVAEPKSESGENRWIQEPYFDRDGNVWYTERTRGAPAILRLDPRTATFDRFPTPNPGWSPHGIVVDPMSEQTIVWWAGRGVDVARLDPSTGEMKTYGDTSSPMRWGGHTPVFDSTGDLWYSMIAADRIGRWDRETDSVEHWPIPTPGGRPYGILVDHDDNVWFAEFYGCRVTRFEPSTETFREFTSPSSPCTLRRLGLDADGRIWYGVFDEGKLGVLDPGTGEMREYLIGRFSEPYEAWLDPRGDVWMTDGGQGGMLIRFDPGTETFTSYPSPLQSDMPKMAITREGAVWYSNRSIAAAGDAPATVGVLYPDVARMTTLGAYYEEWNGRVVGSGSPAPRPPASVTESP